MHDCNKKLTKINNMKNANNRHIVLFSVILGTVFGLISCCSENKTNANSESAPPAQIEKSEAVFDYFNYSGTDDYFINNPLTEPDQFYNPILPGWYSDPSICSNGEDYFLVTSTFVYYPGVPIFHSKDLVNWKQIGHVLDRPSQLINFEDQRTSRGIFAPAISYNPHNETYYMITTNVNAGNFFVKTKDPFGSWSEPVYLKEVGGIDPSFFFDDDGKAYIVNNDAPIGEPLYDGHRAIWVHEFDVNAEKVVGKSKLIINGGVDITKKPVWIEGPHIQKINGKYLLTAAEGGTSVNHSQVVFSSDAPMGTYIPWDKNPILTQRHLSSDREYPITCVGHADLVQTKEGDWWAVFLGCRPVDGNFENLGRETFIMPVQWSEDGFPYMTRGDELVPMILQKKGFVRNDDFVTGNFEKNDDFSSENLDMEWIGLRAPFAGLYSLTKNPGFLSLPCIDVASYEMKTPAYIGRRLQHHSFECETKMYFDPADENDAAGMLIYKDEKHQYFLSVRKTEDARKVCVEKIGESGAEIMVEQAIESAKPVYLKVVSTGLTFDFYYTVGEKIKDWKLISKGLDAQYLSTANAGGFTGTTIGVYATKK